MSTKKPIETTRELTAEELERLQANSGTVTGGVKLPVTNKISLNGNADAEEQKDGSMKRPPIAYRKMIMVGKPNDEAPKYEDLGSPIEVIFVKIRRRLVARDSQGFQIMSSSQHSSPTSIVTIWKDGKMIDKGVAKDLREKYEDLRTIQEVYALLPDGELVNLTVKGASLGSKTRDEKLPTFYQYVQQLDKNGGIFAHKTILGGVLEKGAKSFYTMTFEMGRPTTNEEKLMVLDKQDELTDIITKYDAENSASSVTKTESDDIAEEVSEDVEPF